MPTGIEIMGPALTLRLGMGLGAAAGALGVEVDGTGLEAELPGPEPGFRPPPGAVALIVASPIVSRKDCVTPQHHPRSRAGRQGFLKTHKRNIQSGGNREPDFPIPPPWFRLPADSSLVLD